jgi:hypothetical protein
VLRALDLVAKAGLTLLQLLVAAFAIFLYLFGTYETKYALAEGARIWMTVGDWFALIAGLGILVMVAWALLNLPRLKWLTLGAMSLTTGALVASLALFAHKVSAGYS